MPFSPQRALLPGRVLAAPSWVMPGTIEENCSFLAGAVDEAGLLFMESSACLAYDRRDLPLSLADLPLSYHVHLPVDLPMDEPSRAAGICARLLDAVDYLSAARRRPDVFPKTPGASSASAQGEAMIARSGGMIRAVLHPPCHEPADAASAARLLASFAEAWLLMGRNPSQFLLENVRANDLTCLTEVIREYAFGLCLDMGHLLAYGQEQLLRRCDLIRRVQMLHVNAPPRSRRTNAHLPLSSLDAAGQRQAERICKCVPKEAVIMMELFSWRHIEESLPLLRSWL